MNCGQSGVCQKSLNILRMSCMDDAHLYRIRPRFMACTCFQACRYECVCPTSPHSTFRIVGPSGGRVFHWRECSNSAFICPSVPLENGSVAAIHLPAAAAAERSGFGSLRARLRNQVGHTCEPDGARLRARVRGLGARCSGSCVAHKLFFPLFTSTLEITFS